jgi:hypothetical protein
VSLRTFTISEVRAGWIIAQLHSERGTYVVTGSYTPNDAIRDFADAVASLATIVTERCGWSQGPSEAKWEFTRTGAIVDVAVQFDDGRIECTFPWPRFATDVLDALESLQADGGVAEYEREWRRQFPHGACRKLEDAVRGKRSGR